MVRKTRERGFQAFFAALAMGTGPERRSLPKLARQPSPLQGDSVEHRERISINPKQPSNRPVCSPDDPNRHLNDTNNQPNPP